MKKSMSISGWNPVEKGTLMYSDSEMQDIRAIGIEEMNNLILPPGTADKIQMARMQATIETGWKPGEDVHGVTEPDRVIPIDQLPEKYKLELRQFIMDAQPEMRTKASVNAQVKVMVPQNPEVAKQLSSAMQVAAENLNQQKEAVSKPVKPTVRRPGVTLVEPPQAPIYRAPPAVAPSPNVAIHQPPPPPPPPPQEMPKVTFYQQEDTTQVNQPEPPVDRHMADTTKPIPRNCPRCMFGLEDGRQVEEPTEDDLRNYKIQVVISGHRFYKDYVLFNGDLVLRFRTLMAKEDDAMVAQLVIDEKRNVDNGGTVDPDLMIGNRIRYGMVMSLESIRKAGVESKFMNFDEFVKANPNIPPNERVLVFYTTVIEDALPTCHLRDIALEYYDKFYSYCMTMELRAYDPKFWPTIRV